MDMGMNSIPQCIEALESYLERGGVRLVRAALPECIHGRVSRRRITLRAGLSPPQELVALVHELTHWLVHREARGCMDCTLFEYEAEAVEALVMARLGLPQASAERAFDGASPTDHLLAASVARVTRASARIFAALSLDPALGMDPETNVSEAQTPIDLEAAAGKKVVFEYEQRGVGNFLGPTKTL